MSKGAAPAEDIVGLEEGFTQVKKNGIDPFINLIETGEREFFKAKDFVVLYDLIFKMCIQRDPYNWTEKMYDRYSSSILNYLVDKVRPRMQQARESYETAFLKEWKTRWNNQKLIVKGFSKLFTYLDRFFTANTDGILPLKEQGYKLYKENVFDAFSHHAKVCILNAIQRERNSEEQDRQLLRESVEVFVEMGYNFADKKLKVYQSDLEKFIVEHAGDYYKRQSRIWMDQDSCPNYLEKAEKMLNEEKNRVDTYLNRNTLEPLLRECYVQLLKAHQMDLLTKNTGVVHLLTINSTEDLSRMYRLYSKYPEDLDPIGLMVNDHIQKCGTEIVDKAKEGDSKEKEKTDANHDLVRNLIALHAQFADVVKVCFQNNQVFQKALKKAFEDFINKDNRVSKLLARFVNDLLKKGTKINVKNVESTLDNVVFLYGYIQDKDVFEYDYQHFLANRLLMGLCESEHTEKSMIAKLKTECGYQWTNKLEGMFKDVQLSKDLMLKFKKEVFDTEKNLDILLEVNVCTTGYWPSRANVPANLPKEVALACDKFKRFYLNQHSGHKLDWRLDQGQAELQVQFSPKVRRGLIVTTYQMLIMLVFNSYKTPTFKQILDITGIPRNDIANHLLSLVHPKVSVLDKKPGGNSLDDTHQFRINPNYQNKLLKVSVPLLPPRQVNVNGDNESEAGPALQRRHQMDAAVVRIMKARKTMKHAQLVGEVMQQLSARFKAKPPDIKKRIEALIEQEYLERDAKDRGMYNYLA